MYQLINPSTDIFSSGRKTNFFQLGWLVAWVLDNSQEDYHKRSWPEQRNVIKQKRFVAQLVTCGNFDRQLLEQLPDLESVREVLMSRSITDSGNHKSLNCLIVFLYLV